mgnify:FL=1
MSRELENQIKRAKNMLEYYKEKLIKDETKLKSEKSKKINPLIEIITLCILNIMFFILIISGLATGNILPSLISGVIFSANLDKMVTESKKVKKIKESCLNCKQNIIQDNELIKTYEEKLTKAISKLNELQNENVLESNFTLNSEENLSKPLSRKRILK